MTESSQTLPQKPKPKAFNGEKRGDFFEKIKSGRKIKLGGKFISSHLEYPDHQPMPSKWGERVNCILTDLAALESKNPTPAGNFATLESNGLKCPAEVSKWIGRDASGGKKGIIGVNLSQTSKMFVDIPHAYILNENTIYVHPIPPNLIEILSDAVRRSENKFKGSKVCRTPATGKTEDALTTEGYQWIAGMDEAGRGPLAGPIVGAVVCITQTSSLPPVGDSKGIPEDSRDLFARNIMKTTPYGIGIVEAEEIDRIGIEAANKLIFMRAFDNLKAKFPQVSPEIIVIDGNPIKESQVNFPVPFRCIIKGEQTSRAIAAASILAKTTRDQLMLEEAKKYPEYRFEEHKGYGTPVHLKKLEAHGPCPSHRLCFSPVKKAALAHGLPTKRDGAIEDTQQDLLL